MSVSQLRPPNPQINHSFFMEIGTPYRWYSRLDWSLTDWKEYANHPDVATWVGLFHGCPFGYFELQRRQPSETEIMFFGIFSVYRGQGLGAALLESAVQEAWALAGTGRVYVHTCSSDHTAALSNYLSRGFSLSSEQTETETMPDAGDLLWSSPRYYRTIQTGTS